MHVNRQVSLYTLPGWSHIPPPPTCTQHILVRFQMHMATMNTMGWANAIQDIRSNMTQVLVCALVTAADSSA